MQIEKMHTLDSLSDLHIMFVWHTVWKSPHARHRRQRGATRPPASRCASGAFRRPRPQRGIVWAMAYNVAIMYWSTEYCGDKVAIWSIFTNFSSYRWHINCKPFGGGSVLVVCSKILVPIERFTPGEPFFCGAISHWRFSQQLQGFLRLVEKNNTKSIVFEWRLHHVMLLMLPFYILCIYIYVMLCIM